ncbi:MAG TPA: type II toxin-antitoxin system VapC family toxin [Thermoanaerobaculia bacterium]|nr:type II toxin-antitoxin system VapC family toxin [Thermoanaerobaculia bacterium]
MGEVRKGLLDTSVVIAREEDPGIHESLPREFSVSAATLAELQYGILVAKDEVTRRLRLRRLGDVESTMEALAIDAAVARSFAMVAHAVKTAGRQPKARVMDLWIAATALTHKIPLYTRNPDDFHGLQELIEIIVI